MAGPTAQDAAQARETANEWAGDDWNIGDVVSTGIKGWFSWQEAKEETKRATAQAQIKTSADTAKMSISSDKMKWIVIALIIGGVAAIAVKGAK